MGGHTDRADMMVLDVVDTGRRRRWTDEEKLRIVGESHAGPRLVAATARRNGISRSLLTTWRRLHREGLLVERTASFAPVTVETERPVPPPMAAEPRPAAPTATLAADTSHRIEVVLLNGRRLVVDARLEPSALARLIAVVEGT
jgi:transposase